MDQNIWEERHKIVILPGVLLMFGPTLLHIVVPIVVVLYMLYDIFKFKTVVFWLYFKLQLATFCSNLTLT